MAYDTEADFAAMYRRALVDPVTNYTYYGFKSPNMNNGQPITINVPYCRAAWFPLKESLADRIVAHVGITANDSIILFGGAFGWLGEWIERKTGASCVSVDTSTWVNTTQSQNQDDKLKQAIEANPGLTISDGLGKELYDKFADPGPACRIYGGVVNESLSDNDSRQRVIAKLPRNPTLVITEEVWQILTDAEKTEYASRLTAFGVRILHIIGNTLIDGP